MSKLLNSRHEIDLHIDNLCFMYSETGYIPVYYQLALIKGLSGTTEGMVLYFMQELSAKNKQLLIDYFGTPVELEIPLCPTGRIEELKNLL